MTLPYASVNVAPSETDSRLRGWRLMVARAVWLVVSLLSGTLFVASVPAFYREVVTLSVNASGSDVNPETLRAGLAQLGLSSAYYGGYFVVLMCIFVPAYCAVGALIFWRRSDERMALLVSLWLVLFGTLFPPVSWVLEGRHPAVDVLLSVLSQLAFMSFFILPYLFPNGRFVPRWTRWAALLFIATMVGSFLFRGSPLDSDTWPFMLGAWVFFGLVGSMVYAQVYRYRRVSGPVERQQTKWAAFGFSVALASFVGATVTDNILASLSLSEVALTLWDLAFGSILAIGFIAVPVSIGIATLRHRLWDIDPIVNRALVYGSLTACVIGIYVFIVGYLGALLRTDGNLFVSLVATGVVAVLFQPLRERLQRRVNRLMYGERDDPYRVLSRLGRRLEATLAPDAVLSTIAESVREALRLPYAAITLRKKGSEGDGILETAAEAGKPVGKLVRLPLAYQNEPVGELLVASRPGEEELSAADGRLLEDLARQAGVAAHAVRLTNDLQRSRERLVTAREEERRRLRRDLHDGLGAQLAGLNVQSGILRRLIRRDPEAAEELVLELREALRSAIADIRRLVHDLRPPALDEMGLVGALRRLAER
jgi:signal transduction histidine kinase